MSDAKGFRSPIGRARGLGSAKHGVEHFWMQRVTAVALVPLTLWFVFSVAQLPGMTHAAAAHWISSPSVAVVLVLYLVALMYHSALGVQVVIEDYVAGEGKKLFGLLASQFLHFLVGAMAVFAVLKVALGA